MILATGMSQYEMSEGTLRPQELLLQTPTQEPMTKGSHSHTKLTCNGFIADQFSSIENISSFAYSPYLKFYGHCLLYARKRIVPEN